MSWASTFPNELLSAPHGLVVLTGLDVTYNAVHKTIWDGFVNNRMFDRVPLQFKILEADHEYPKCRTKRTSYEWYIPKGILKSHWMKKHTQQVPAVVVLFFDLDWDEQQWKEKEMQCATKIQIVRSSLANRGTKVAVVLVQHNAPLPPGEDMTASERAASLCSACELSAKSLFVLPHSDHLLGYIIRLENAFYELSQSYYHSEARKVKAHKEFLNKTTHQLLFVRHQFKIGFYNELKQESHTSLKHYKQAYSAVLELRIHDTNILEVKTIAGFVNYKVCHLSFQHNAPLDAIAQFRRHIDFYKTKEGIGDLLFEHSAWMATQFQMFGDLFDEAIKKGLAAIQTQHPGFYYQQAALHSITRKKHCHHLCKVDSCLHTDALDSLEKLDYYGQRPWRQGNQSIEPADPVKEREGILALQEMECAEDHSWIIIPLLNNAKTQFNKYKSPRMKLYLMVQLGEEFFHAKAYKEALRRLKPAIWPFRTDGWKPLVTTVLKTALCCAYAVVSIVDYVTLSIELLSRCVNGSPSERQRIQQNLYRVLECKAPDPESDLDEECVKEATEKWQAAPTDIQDIQVDMHQTASFIQCRSCFTAKSFTADNAVVFKVYIKITSPGPVHFTKLSVLLSNKEYDEHCIITDENRLLLSPDNQGTVFTFSFIPQACDVNQEIKSTSVVMEFGSELRSVIMHWSNNTRDLSQVVPPEGGESSCVIDGIDWNNPYLNTHTTIEPRAACVDIVLTHNSPVLVAELYPIDISITNTETATITGVKISVGLKSGADENCKTSTIVKFDGESADKGIKYESATQVGDLEPQQKIEKRVCVQNNSTGDRILLLKVWYMVAVEHNEQSLQCVCSHEQTIVLPTVQPFTVDFTKSSMLFETCEFVHAEELFLVEAYVMCTSPWPIRITATELALNYDMKLGDEDFESQLENVSLSINEGANECICLQASHVPQNHDSMGSYTVRWQRQSTPCTSDIVVSTTHTLPPINVHHAPLHIELSIPAYGYVRQLYTVKYTLHNRTPYPQDVEASMDTSDTFMFMGNKLLNFRLLPCKQRTLTFAMFPLLAGCVALPKLALNMPRFPDQAQTVINRVVPTNVYIKPYTKSRANQQVSS